MSDPRHFEYFRCPECRRDWRVWAPHSYDPTDSCPMFQSELCIECIDDKVASMRLSEDRARTLKHSIQLPRTSEPEAEAIASRINQRLPYSWTSSGRRYKVLNNYPSGTLRLALIGR
jgi:hypothetical protein